MTEVSLSPKITASVKFPATLWDMINKCKSSAISWGRFGTCVKINKGAFEKEYLTSGEKFSSFIRQLNMYGFRKLKNQIKYVGMPPEFCNDEVEYEHPLFVKCHPELLPYVRRKATKRNDKNRSARRNYQTETSPRVSEDNTVCTKLVSDMANRNEEDNRENKQSQVDNDSSTSQLSKTNINEIFQVVSQTLSEEVLAFGGGARISGPVFPSFNLSSPKRICSQK